MTTQDPQVAISVVIPTYNRTKLLKETIPALANQETGGRTYEVIFVSNGSTDHTPEVLAQAERDHPGLIRWDHIKPTGGPSAPRNRGIEMAEAPVVLILDDDVVPEPDMVRAHAEFHERHPEETSCGLGEAYVPEELLHDCLTLFHAYPYDEVRRLDTLTHQHFWTCCVSFKRRFMLEHGMFDESLLYYEDVEVARRLADAGMVLRFVPAARGAHLHQLRASGVPAKGEFTGRWLFAFEQRFPEPEIRRRHGILHPSIGGAAYARRLLNRLGFFAVASAPSMGLMQAMGATRGARSKLSDLYYYCLFRKNMLRGYREARREARQQAAADAVHRRRLSDSSWVDRGESEFERGNAPPLADRGVAEG